MEHVIKQNVEETTHILSEDIHKELVGFTIIKSLTTNVNQAQVYPDNKLVGQSEKYLPPVQENLDMFCALIIILILKVHLLRFHKKLMVLTICQKNARWI